MKIQCPNCEAVYRMDSSRIPDRGVYARCKNCNTRFMVNKPKSSENASKENEKITCPKCGYEQPQFTDCIRCGIVFTKFSAAQAKKQELEKETRVEQLREVVNAKAGEEAAKDGNEELEGSEQRSENAYKIISPSHFRELFSKQNLKIAVVIIAFFAVLTPIFSIYFVNYFKLQRPMNNVLKRDPRNKGIEISVHYGNYINPTVIIYDLKSVSGNSSKADVFRVLLCFAKELKSREYQAVELCFRGKLKFKTDGKYFKKIGEEYSWQNPAYTIRTFPEHVRKPNGSQAYPTWRGGVLVVLAKQMEDFNDFHDKWYFEEMVGQIPTSTKAVKEETVEKCNTIAKSTIYSVKTALEVYFADNMRYTDHIPSLLEEFEFPTKNLTIIIDASDTTYSLEVVHKNGDRVYLADSENSEISERSL